MKIKTVLDVTGSHTDQYAKYGVGNYGCAVFDCEPTEQQIKECLANGQGVERANGKFYPPEGWGDERQEMENQPKVSNIIAFAIALLVTGFSVGCVWAIWWSVVESAAIRGITL